MNPIQRFMAWAFDRQYVLLVMHDNSMPVCHAYQVGGKWYAHPYLPKTRCELKPGGEVFGQSYIDGWKPATPLMFDHFGPENA